MGSVWEGVHETLHTRVAVKFIDTAHAASAEARNRFVNEARAAASLRSKHVVEVYDHGVSEDGRPFIVMEYLEGEPLDRRLDRVGRLAPKEAALLLQQVCRALTKAHAIGIIHRDLKPENVFLVRDDEDGTDIAKVVDFGIAKFTDSALGPSSATRTGSVLGTPYYMSPEQARGLRSVDHRADLWSLGVIAFRSVVGVLPFDGEAIGDLLVKLCTAEIPVPSRLAPDVPPGFDAFIAKALSRDVAQRFDSAQEFANSLCAVCGLSVRGIYGTGDVPLAPPATSGQPSLPALSAGRRLAATTADPLMQTPSPVVTRSRRGALLGAGLAALALLGVGVALALRAAAPSAPVAVSTAAPGRRAFCSAGGHACRPAGTCYAACQRQRCAAGQRRSPCQRRAGPEPRCRPCRPRRPAAGRSAGSPQAAEQPRPGRPSRHRHRVLSARAPGAFRRVLDFPMMTGRYVRSTRTCNVLQLRDNWEVAEC